MTERPAAAFFDLDRTLLFGSSAAPFVAAAWRHKIVGPKELTKDVFRAVTFALVGATDEQSEAARERFLSRVAGVSEEGMLEVVLEVLPKLVDGVRPEAQRLLDMHAEGGRDRFIISASPQEIVGALAEALELEGGMGTRGEIVDGVYTGKLLGSFCYGEGKAERIDDLAEEKGYDLSLCYAYSDSISDLPMLELVGHPVAVNPDSALRSVAQHRGWPVVVFARRAKMAMARGSLGAGAAGLAAGAYALGRRHGRVLAKSRRRR